MNEDYETTEQAQAEPSPEPSMALERAESVYTTPVAREQDILFLGRAMAASGLFKGTTSASQAIVRILAGRELGFGPVASCAGIHIIQGRVVPGANIIAAAIKRSGKYNYKIVEHTSELCAIDFYEDSELVGRSTFTLADAAAAGVTGKDVWKSYPKNMLFARAISNGARWYCPDIFGGGVYDYEEMGHEEYGEYDGNG